MPAFRVMLAATSFLEAAGRHHRGEKRDIRASGATRYFRALRVDNSLSPRWKPLRAYLRALGTKSAFE